MRRRRALYLAVSLLALLGGCANGPGTPTPPISPAYSGVAEVQRPERARWLKTGGATRIGPALPQGMLVLMGGRRALVHPDGAVSPERVLSPEPLRDIVLVPSQGGNRVVGCDDHTVYRFDDPLGAPIPLVTTMGRMEIDHIGAGPGLVIVWTGRPGSYANPPPVAIDVATGKKKMLSDWPEVRLLDVAFKTNREGVALFSVLGIAVTRDGGKTFRALEAAKPEQMRLVNRVARRGDELWATRGAWRAPIDFDSNMLGPLTPGMTGQAPTLEWITATGVDPMEVAIDEGSLDPRGNIVAAIEGFAVRVNSKTGGVIEMRRMSTPSNEAKKPEYEPEHEARYRPPEQMCRTAHLRTRGLFLCPSGARAFPLQGSLELLPLATFNPPENRRSWDLVYRPGGGFAHFGACRTEEHEGPGSWICTLQKGASFVTIPLPPEAYGSDGLGVLSDGRLVYLDTGRHLHATEDPQELFKGLLPPFVVIVDGQGNKRAFSTIALPPSNFPPSVLGTIEEGDDGALHALLANDNGIYSIRQSMNAPATWTKLPGRRGTMRRGRGAVLGEELLISSDAGVSWSEAGPQPPLPSDPMREQFVVGEAGLRVGTWLRVGWGEGDPFSPPSSVVPAPNVLEEPEPSIAPSRRLVCKRRGVLGAAPALWDEDARATLFDRTRALRTTAGQSRIDAQGLRRSGILRRNGIAERFEAFAKDPKAESPTQWYLDFVDARETSGKVHTWTGAAPPGVPFSAELRNLYRAGRRIFFSVHHSSRNSSGAFADLVLISSRGETRMVRVAIPGGDKLGGVAMSEDDSGPIFLTIDKDLFVWEMGGTPRKLASSHPAHDGVLLGLPSGRTVPVLLQGYHGASMRVISADIVPDSSPFWPLGGWRAVPLSTNDVLSLPPCGPNAPGALFRNVAGDTSFAVEIDGQKHTAERWASFDVRVGDGSACMAGIDVFTYRPNASKQEIGFATVDLPRKSGHAVEMGQRARFQKLECELL